MFGFDLNPWSAVKKQQEEFDEAMSLMETKLANIAQNNIRLMGERDEWKKRYETLGWKMNHYLEELSYEISLIQDNHLPTFQSGKSETPSTGDDDAV